MYSAFPNMETSSMHFTRDQEQRKKRPCDVVTTIDNKQVQHTNEHAFLHRPKVRSAVADSVHLQKTNLSVAISMMGLTSVLLMELSFCLQTLGNQRLKFELLYTNIIITFSIFFKLNFLSTMQWQGCRPHLSCSHSPS